MTMSSFVFCCYSVPQLSNLGTTQHRQLYINKRIQQGDRIACVIVFIIPITWAATHCLQIFLSISGQCMLILKELIMAEDSAPHNYAARNTINNVALVFLLGVYVL